jgi:hypothetical protein
VSARVGDAVGADEIVGSGVGAGIGTDVGAGIGTDVGAGIGTAVGAGIGTDVGAGCAFTDAIKDKRTTAHFILLL